MSCHWTTHAFLERFQASWCSICPRRNCPCAVCGNRRHESEPMVAGPGRHCSGSAAAYTLLEIARTRARIYGRGTERAAGGRMSARGLRLSTSLWQQRLSHKGPCRQLSRAQAPLYGAWAFLQRVRRSFAVGDVEGLGRATRLRLSVCCQRWASAPAACLCVRATANLRHAGCGYFSTCPRAANRRQAVERHEQSLSVHLAHFGSCRDDCALCQEMLSSGDWTTRGHEQLLHATDSKSIARWLTFEKHNKCTGDAACVPAQPAVKRRWSRRGDEPPAKRQRPLEPAAAPVAVSVSPTGAAAGALLDLLRSG